MPHQRLDGDRNGLVRLVRDDQPDPLLAGTTRRIALDAPLVLVEPRAPRLTQIEPRFDGLTALDELLYGLLRGPLSGSFGSSVPVLIFCHYPSFSCFFWFRTVRSLAMFLRTSLSCPVFSNCPVACWKRRLKSSRLVATRRSSSSSTSSSRASVAFTADHPLAPGSGSLSGASGRPEPWPAEPDP